MDEGGWTVDGEVVEKKVGRPPGSGVNKVAEIRTEGAHMGLDLRYNEFRREVEYRVPGQRWQMLDDFLEYRILTLLGGRKVTVPESLIHATLVTDAMRNPYHPVTEYLDGLVWDGTPRIDTWLTTYCHVEDTPFVRKVGAAFLIAAVRRVRQPGCKFDECLMLVSDEGSGKSTAVKALVPHLSWMTESLNINSTPKQVIEGTRGVWIVEAAEMTGVKDIEKTKAFLSRQVDGPVREAYARNSTSVPRQFVVFATTNQPRPLANETGARRFWPVRTGTIETEQIERDRDQLWAESATREWTEESIHITSEYYWEAVAAQNAFPSPDPWREEIEKMLAARESKLIIPISEVWGAVGVDVSKRTREQSVRITDIMKKLWYRREEQPKYVPGHGMVRVFTKIRPFDKDGVVTARSGGDVGNDPPGWSPDDDPGVNGGLEEVEDGD